MWPCMAPACTVGMELTDTWFITVALLVGYTVLGGLLILNYFKGKIGERVRKRMGIQIYFWQEAVVLGMIMTAMTLYLLKRADLLS